MAKKNLTKKLWAFLPDECEKSGVKLGGWGCSVTPAFDPEIVDVNQIKESFGGQGKSLFAYIGDAIDYFKERRTGPDNKHHGIYASTKRIPSKYLKKLD